MNPDQIKGAPKDAAGGVQERFGELIVSPEQEARGIAKEVEGFAQKKAGDLKEAIQEAVKKISCKCSKEQTRLGSPSGFCVAPCPGSLLNIYSYCEFIHVCYNPAVGEIMLAPRNGGWPPTRNIARWSSLVARRAHNPKVVGLNPALATNKALVGNGQGFFAIFMSYFESKIRVARFRL